MDPGTSGGGSPRFSRITFNDHAGQLWIVTILSLTYSSLAVAARAYIKYKMFGFDDILIVSATVLQMGQSIAMFIGLSNGVGKFNSITGPEQWTTSSKSTLAAVILCLLSLSFAKCSLLALVLRIIGPKTGQSKPFCIGLMALSAAWGVGSCISFLVNCRADTLLTVDSVKQCPSQTTRWAVITAVDILTEILAWLLVVKLAWGVSMPVKRKMLVIMAFSFRLPLIALSAVHLAYIRKYQGSAEPQFVVTNSLLFQQTMIVWSIISATVPNLKNFLKSFSIGMGFPVSFDLSMYGSSNAYALQSLENRSKATSSAAADAATESTRGLAYGHSDYEHRFEPHSAEAHHYGNGNNRENLSEEERSRTGSQDMIINKEVEWKVTYEYRR